MKIFGSIEELVNLVFRKGSRQITLKPNQTVPYTVDRNVELPPEDANGILMSATSTATMTNKTFDANGTGNSLSNVEPADFKAESGDADKVLVRATGTGAVTSAKIVDANVDGNANISLGALASVTINRALQSDGSGKIIHSSVTSTELGHLSGVTSNIQTQLDAKVDENAPIVGATATKITFDSKGLVTAGTALAAGDMPSGIDATKIGAGSVDNTEFGYLNGLTSSAVGVSDSQNLTNKTIASGALTTGALTLPTGTQAQRPGEAGQDPVSAGMIRYNTTTNSFEGYSNSVWSGIGGGGTTDLITQASHGFVVGDVLYLNGATYTKAIATAANTAEVVGMVSRVINASTFELTLSGEVSGLTGLTAGEAYFLSAATAGATTVTEPSTIGQVSVPIGVASSTTTMYVAPKRGVVVGGVNARAEVALTNAATTNVQNVAGMTGGELSGWVFISSSPAKRFYVSAKFSLSGTGGDYNLSYQTSGDTPPTGFLVSITTVGMIQVTLPASSGSTSVINYALNAPAIGASLPLTLDASRLLSGTVPAARLPAPTTYSDAEATMMGLKRYLHGGSYKDGLAPTVTLLGGGGTLSSVNSSSFVPYQASDNTWRLKFNITVTLSSAARTSIDLGINGVSFPSSSQAVSGNLLAAANIYYTIANGGTSAVSLSFASVTCSSVAVSGDVALALKPTWAY